MDAEVQRFLERFAELEKRVRKLKAEERGLREEVKDLRRRLKDMEARCGDLGGELDAERKLKAEAVRRIDGLIAGLTRFAGSGGTTEAPAGE